MKLTTIRTLSGTRAARVENDGTLVELPCPDVGELLNAPDWRAVAGSGGGAIHEAMFTDRAPLVPRPGKIICVGRDNRDHVLASQVQKNLTRFAMLPAVVIGSRDAITLTSEPTTADWEPLLAVVLGAPVQRASEAEAEAAIAGFSIFNAVTMRNGQCARAGETPFGPTLVTPDEVPGGVRPRVTLRGFLDGVLVQETCTAALVLDPVALVRYLSRIVPLGPGDVIATGTPGGASRIGGRSRPLVEGSVLEAEIDEIGFQENVVRSRFQT
jgi:acylpyruvate hydrolase